MSTMTIQHMKNSNWLKGFVVIILICSAAYAGFVYGKKHTQKKWQTFIYHSEARKHASQLKVLMSSHSLLEAEQTPFVKSTFIDEIVFTISMIELLEKANLNNPEKPHIDETLKEAKLYVQRYPEQGAKAILEAKPE